MDIVTNCANETWHIGGNTNDVSNQGSPVEAETVTVHVDGYLGVRAVEVLEFQFTSSDDIVISNHDGGDTTQEDGVGT